MVLLSLALWLFNSMQFSGLGDRSLDIGGGEGVHPSSLRTDNFSSGVFKGGKLSAVSRMSLILAVTERSSGCNRPSGDGGSSTFPPDSTAADSRALSSKQDFIIGLDASRTILIGREDVRRSGRFVHEFFYTSFLHKNPKIIFIITRDKFKLNCNQGNVNEYRNSVLISDF